MSSMQPEHKHNHHKLPRLYLKGFVEKEGEPFIWIYRRGASYNPGQVKHKYNPYRTSLKSAGAERDYYAYTNEQGETDYDTYENILEKQEKPANPVFEKIRNRQLINASEKEILASYILMMMKRVPHGREKAKELWFKAVELFESKSGLKEWIDEQEANTDISDLEKRKKLAEMRTEMEETLARYRQEIPPDSLLNHTVSKTGLSPVVCNMTWQFFIAPQGHRFLTGDNPVFYFESVGLNSPFSELTFPVSSHIALVASWRKQLKEDFIPANPVTVKEINRRTASIASEELFFSRSAKWVVEVFNKQHKYSLIYPYSGGLA